jgi:hypothetical protein
MSGAVSSIVLFILKWAGYIFGVLLVFFVLSLVPLDNAGGFVGAFFTFLSFIFGEAGPRLGRIALDAIASRFGG